MMSVRTYRPLFRILITKNIYRIDGVSSRKAVSDKTNSGIWDLTPYLGEGSVINIKKSLYRPMGAFIITIPDQPFSTTPGAPASDSLYGLLDATDGIEIYAARSPETYAMTATSLGKTPILMRGFIREISRSEVIGPDGRPRRQIIIEGNDYACVFEMLRMWNLGYTILGIPEEFQAFFRYEDATTMPTQELMAAFVKIGNQFLDYVYAQGGWNWTIKTDFRVTEGRHAMLGLNGQEGPLWAIMAKEADMPWNELYVIDKDDFPYLVYRPAPWKEYTVQGKKLVGTYLPQGSQTISAETITVPIEDIVSIDLSRSDDGVSNIFWLTNPLSIQVGFQSELIALASKENRPLIFESDHKNNDPLYYGERLQIASYRQWPNETTGQPLWSKDPEFRKNRDAYFEFWKNRLHWFRNSIHDNVVLENGRITLKGNEHIKIGMYIRVTRGAFEWEGYVVAVTHTYSVFQRFTTTVDVIRATCYWERTLSEANPSWAEGKKGVYDD